MRLSGRDGGDVRDPGGNGLHEGGIEVFHHLGRLFLAHEDEETRDLVELLLRELPRRLPLLRPPPPAGKTRPGGIGLSGIDPGPGFDLLDRL